ncbi:hypothetical protein D3C75_1278970 [compost metagenome]
MIWNGCQSPVLPAVCRSFFWIRPRSTVWLTEAVSTLQALATTVPLIFTFDALAPKAHRPVSTKAKLTVLHFMTIPSDAVTLITITDT